MVSDYRMVVDSEVLEALGGNCDFTGVCTEEGDGR